MGECVSIKVDERHLYKAAQFLQDGLKKDMSFLTKKALACYFLDRLKNGDPLAKYFMKTVCDHLDDEDFRRKTISPHEKGIFEDSLSMFLDWQHNRKLKK